jgi:hypothetical protein
MAVPVTGTGPAVLARVQPVRDTLRTQENRRSVADKILEGVIVARAWILWMNAAGVSMAEDTQVI